MEEWIRQLIDAATKPIRVVAQGAADRIAGVYNNFTNALGRARSAFGNWVNKGKAWVTAQGRNALAVAYFVAWLIRYYLPALVAKGLTDARKAAVALVNAGVALALAEIGKAKAWALGLIHAIDARLEALGDSLLAKLKALGVDLAWVRNLAVTLLTSPQRMAAWLAGAMITAIIDYAIDHAADFAEIAWRNRKLIERRSVALVDEIVDRIM